MSRIKFRPVVYPVIIFVPVKLQDGRPRIGEQRLAAPHGAGNADSLRRRGARGADTAVLRDLGDGHEPGRNGGKVEDAPLLARSET